MSRLGGWGLGCGLALGLAGCEFVEVVETALPAQPSAASLFLAVERSTEPKVDVRAFDLTQMPKPSFSLEGVATDEGVQLSASFYRESLAELEVSSGLQVTDPSFCFDITNVEERSPLATFTRAISDRGIERLQPLLHPSRDLLDARFIPGRSACETLRDTFDIEEIGLDATNDAAFATRLADGTVLVGTQATIVAPQISDTTNIGTVWLLTDLGHATRVERVEFVDSVGNPHVVPPGHEPTWTAAPTWDGKLLLSDVVNPWLWVAEFRRDAGGPKLAITATRGFAASDDDDEEFGEDRHGRYKWTQTNRPGEPDEIFALSWEGHFERWTPSEPPLLIHDFGNLAGILSHAALLRLGPGEALAGFNSKNALVHYDDGEIRMETVTPEGGISALGRHPNGTVYAGSPHGALYERGANGEWREVRDLELGIPMSRIVPWRDGLLLTGTNGFVGRTVMRSGEREHFYLCRQGLGHSVRLDAVLGEDALLFTGAPPPGRAQPQVAILRPKTAVEPIPRCAR